MKRTEHTPGPWKIHGERMSEAVEPPVYFASIKSDARGNDIAMLQGYIAETPDPKWDYTPEQCAADAALIAAAPELLEALENLLEWSDPLEAPEAHQKAREAIAKAKGDPWAAPDAVG